MKMIYLQFSLDHELLLPRIISSTSCYLCSSKFKAAAADGLGEDTIT